MNSSNVEDVIEYFEQKIALLRFGFQLRSMDEAAANAILDITKMLDDLKNIQEETKAEIEKARNYASQFKMLKSKLQEQENVVSAFASEISASRHHNGDIMKKTNVESEKRRPLNSRTNQSEPLTIENLTSQEFSAVPKYMKGRLTVESINNVICEFNKCIKAKYRLLSLPQSQLNIQELQKVRGYKKQEIRETRGFYFCTIDDLKEHTTLKTDNLFKMAIMILRHCSRLTEIRGPGQILRYAVQVPKNNY